jgi:hypothetical protein
MTENKFDVQTMSTKRTDKQTDCILLLGQVKAYLSHFLKFLLPTRQMHIWFCLTRKPILCKTQRAVFYQPINDN